MEGRLPVVKGAGGLRVGVGQVPFLKGLQGREFFVELKSFKDFQGW